LIKKNKLLQVFVLEFGLQCGRNIGKVGEKIILISLTGQNESIYLMLKTRYGIGEAIRASQQLNIR
jgi:hypothetical protein